MKTHTLTFRKTQEVKNTPGTPSFRDRFEDWLIRKILGRIKD